MQIRLEVSYHFPFLPFLPSHGFAAGSPWIKRGVVSTAGMLEGGGGRRCERRRLAGPPGGDLTAFDLCEDIDEGVFKFALLAMELGDRDAIEDEPAQDSSNDLVVRRIDAEAGATLNFVRERDVGCGQRPFDKFPRIAEHLDREDGFGAAVLARDWRRRRGGRCDRGR